MKKKLLFVIESLGNGGAEKSLVTLLSLLDYSRYEVDLQLFRRGGMNEIYLPKEVNILPVLSFFSYCKASYGKQIRTPIKFARKALYSLAIRQPGLTHPDRARLFWKYNNRSFDQSARTYDIAISYAQGVPTFYVADRVKASKKIAWVNAMLKLSNKSCKYFENYYSKFDFVNAVSEGTGTDLKITFPKIENNKISIIKDIISAEQIAKLADDKDNSQINYEEDYIITISRLAQFQKGLDILLETANHLFARNNGINIKWYIIGDGEYRAEMIKYINNHGLEDKLILLGATPNPYYSLKRATIYVQTSRSEGFGLSIAEARLLNIPVVTTAYDGWQAQMIPDKNGIVVPINPEAVADAIIDLLEHPEKREAISAYQRTEKKGNTEEIEKFYALL